MIPGENLLSDISGDLFDIRAEIALGKASEVGFDDSLHRPLYNDEDAYNVDVYNMGVFRYEGLYIGTPAMYHAVGNVPNYPNTDGFHLVQLACSRDMKNWDRLGDRKAFIGPSPLGAGAYDLTQIIGPSSAVIRRSNIFLRSNWENGELLHRMDWIW